MKKTCLLLLLASIAALGESNGVLVGLVVAPSGQAVRHRHIVLVQEGEGTRREATTDESGIFAFGLLPPGTYRIETDRGQLLSSSGNRIVLRTDEKRSWRLVWTGKTPQTGL